MGSQWGLNFLDNYASRSLLIKGYGSLSEGFGVRSDQGDSCLEQVGFRSFHSQQQMYVCMCVMWPHLVKQLTASLRQMCLDVLGTKKQIIFMTLT